MKKLLLSVTLILAISVQSFSQYTDTGSTARKNQQNKSVYKIKPWIDIPATVVFAGLALNGMRVIYGRDTIPVSELQGLNISKINSFDRSVADNYSEEAKKASDLFFYGSMPLPLFLLIDPAIRKDGPKVGLLYLQAMGLTGTVYSTSAMIANRYRPYAYNPNVPIEDRQRGGARNSFYAGHPSVVATATFFMAKVYTDYHPNMRNKWILYTTAGALSATTGYLRIRAGQHFKTDVIVGVVMGAAIGVLVPHFHKNKAFQRLTILPNYQNRQGGFTASYKLN